VSASIRESNPSGRWLTFHSRFLAVSDQHIIIERPMPVDGCAPHEFVPAEKIGLSFKLKHHKHVCSATIAGSQVWHVDGPDGGADVQTLRLCWPLRMQRLQRRVYMRVDVPSNRIVRVSFWLGGRDAEPVGPRPNSPVWSGTVTNLSAGGLQLRCDAAASDNLESGDTVGMRLLFGLGEETVYADAQFRHVEASGIEPRLGFQFVGLEHSREGQQVIQAIANKLAEFQHAAEHQGVMRW
jgi:hypothetical protein